MNIKKYCMLIATFLFLVIGIQSLLVYGSVSVNAQDPFVYTCDDAVGADTEFCKNVNSESSRSILFGDKSMLYMIAQTIVWLVGILSVIMVIIGGFRYVISAGDSNAVQGAKNTIMYALIGVVVAAFSQIIVTFVLSKFI